MPNFNSIFSYFKSLDTFWQENFKDLLKDIITWYNWLIKFQELLKKEANLKNMIWFFKEEFNKKLNGKKYNTFVNFKKTSHFWEYIKKNYDYKNSWILWTIAFWRKIALQKLSSNNFICDIVDKNILELIIDDTILNDFIIKKVWKKELNLNKLKKEYIKITKKKKPSQDDIDAYIYMNVIFLYIIPTYWEDELNRELNLDKSFTNISLFNTNIKDIENLLYRLQSKWDKDEITSLRFINWKIIINWKEFKINNSPKTQCFLDLIALYFTKNKHEKSIFTYKLEIFWINNLSELNFIKENWKRIEEYLNLKNDNIKNWYLKTLEKKLWKKFINKKIFEMDNWEIKVIEMFLR